MRTLRMFIVALFAGASFIVGLGAVTSTASANECQLEGKPSLHVNVDSCKPKVNEEEPTPTPTTPAPPKKTPKPKPPVKTKAPKPPVKTTAPAPKAPKAPPVRVAAPPVYTSTPDAPVTRDATPPAKFTGKAKCAWTVTIKNKGGEAGSVTVRKVTKSIPAGKSATWVIPGKVNKVVAKGSEGFKKTFTNPCVCAPVAPVTADATPDVSAFQAADIENTGHGTGALIGAGLVGMLAMVAIQGLAKRRRTGSADASNTGEEALAS